MRHNSHFAAIYTSQRAGKALPDRILVRGNKADQAAITTASIFVPTHFACKCRSFSGDNKASGSSVIACSAQSLFTMVGSKSIPMKDKFWSQSSLPHSSRMCSSSYISVYRYSCILYSLSFIRRLAIFSRNCRSLSGNPSISCIPPFSQPILNLAWLSGSKW